MRTLLSLFAAAVLISGNLIFVGNALAETASTNGILTPEGLHYDIRDRSTLMTVEEVVTEGNVKLLLHAEDVKSDARLYPVVFEIYINGRLFSQQITSQTAPVPAGVDIGEDVATVPFNWTVVARVLHPNRTIHSVLEGTAFSASFDSTLDCTLTLSTDETSTDFTNEAVDTIQVDNNSFDLMFDAVDEDGNSIAVSATVAVGESDSASALLELNTGSSTTQIMTSGTAAVEDGELLDFELTSEAGTTTLSCL